MDFKKEFDSYLDLFNNYLKNYLDNLDNDVSPIFREAIAYSVLNGGKRVRPVLCLATAKALGLENNIVLPFALSIELIHSYSLVHDDLECMDNDDYRRGKLSTHKKYGEAMGVLTGDALLNLAIENATSHAKSVEDIKAINEMFTLSGYSGMIKGQVLDMEENKVQTKEYLYEVYINKTSKLLIAPLVIPSILNKNKYYDELYSLGKNLGILFQITDDILDEESSFNEIGKTPKKDKDENKITAISLFGTATAKSMAKEHYLTAKRIVEKLPDNEFLDKFTDYIYERKN